jgi:hypothetical protein
VTGKARPVEDLFCDPAIAAGVADGGAIGRSLREIDDGGDGGLFCSLREVYSCFDQSGLNGINEVSRIGAFHGMTDGVDLMEITDYDIGTQLFQSR